MMQTICVHFILVQFSFFIKRADWKRPFLPNICIIDRINCIWKNAFNIFLMVIRIVDLQSGLRMSLSYYYFLQKKKAHFGRSRSSKDSLVTLEKHVTVDRLEVTSHETMEFVRKQWHKAFKEIYYNRLCLISMMKKIDHFYMGQFYDAIIAWSSLGQCFNIVAKLA